MQTELAFNEFDLLKENEELIKLLTNTSNIVVSPFDELKKPKGIKSNPIPGKPIFFCE